MNIIFLVISALSIIAITIFNPESLLSAFSISANKALETSVSLLAVYIVWLGFIKLFEASGLQKSLTKLFKPIIKFLFNTNDEKTSSEISLSLSANLLGIGGIATPSAIEGMRLLDEKQNEKGKLMLFVISSTSIQILPLSVMQLLAEYGSNTPSIIFLPTLLTTIVSTGLGIILVKVFC